MTALLLIDIQNDFLPGGALAVHHGDQTIPIANHLIAHKHRKFDLVVATQDWHPSTHGSFAVNNPGSQIGSMGKLAGLDQVMWPSHCVQNTKGAEFAPELQVNKIDYIVQKGTDPQIDSYSGFFDNGHRKATGLHEYLTQNKVTRLFVMGLATDYCVKFTALDARTLGYEVVLLRDGCRAVNLKPEDEALAIAEMKSAGVTITTSAEI